MGSRADAFKQAQKQLEEEKNNRGFTPREYDEIPFVGLEGNKVKVFRLIGNPHHVREENFDPKLVLSSKIVDDKGKQFNCHWSHDRDWFLWEVMNKVLAYDWDKDFENPDGSKGRKVYKLAKTNPEMLKRVLHNGKDAFVLPDGRKIEDGGWYPKRSIYMNCICRDDYDWHKENKSYKLIAKKVGESENSEGEKSYFPEFGVPVTCYDFILKTIVEEDGDWEDFDIAIRKEESDPWYSVYSAMDERKIAKQLSCAMNSDPMTDEEKSWTKVDIDKITQVTSYRKIKNRLGVFIKSVDDALGTSFTEKLEKLVEQEKAEWDAKKQEQDDGEQSTETQVEKKQEVKPEVKTRERVKASEVKNEGFANDYEKAKSLGWEKIDDFKKDMDEMGAEVSIDFGKDKASSILHISIDGEEIPQSELYECCTCKLYGPDLVDYCPACGEVFA